MEATMNKSYYDCIFKRKSFHLFRDNITKTPFKSIYKISTEEIASIYNYYDSLVSIYPNINTKIKTCHINMFFIFHAYYQHFYMDH